MTPFPTPEFKTLPPHHNTLSGGSGGSKYVRCTSAFTRDCRLTTPACAIMYILPSRFASTWYTVAWLSRSVTATDGEEAPPGPGYSAICPVWGMNWAWNVAVGKGTGVALGPRGQSCATLAIAASS